jgi:hypothetical protein
MPKLGKHGKGETVMRRTIDEMYIKLSDCEENIDRVSNQIENLASLEALYIKQAREMHNAIKKMESAK